MWRRSHAHWLTRLQRSEREQRNARISLLFMEDLTGFLSSEKQSVMLERIETRSQIETFTKHSLFLAGLKTCTYLEGRMVVGSSESVPPIGESVVVVLSICGRGNASDCDDRHCIGGVLRFFAPSAPPTAITPQCPRRRWQQSSRKDSKKEIAEARKGRPIWTSTRTRE